MLLRTEHRVSRIALDAEGSMGQPAIPDSRKYVHAQYHPQNIGGAYVFDHKPRSRMGISWQLCVCERLR